MKLIAFFMTCLILFVALQPCGDSKECREEITTIVKNPEHGHSHLELCSPFCSCACCATVAVTQKAPLATHVAITFNKTSFHSYKNPSLDKVSGGIWQPPRPVLC